jgi:hypothetical protein
MKRASMMMAAWAALNLMTVATAGAEGVASADAGQSAQAWLALQASNQAAAPARPMDGAQASAAYTRYMKSFDKPIPDRFTSTVKSGDAGSAN